MPTAPRLFFSHLGLLAAVVFSALPGCKPAPLATTAQQTPPDADSVPRQPTTADVQAFIQGMLPAAFKVAEVKMDAPTRTPNAAPGSNVWLLSTKLVLTPAKDLFSLPSPQDTQPIDNLVAELNRLVEWRNAYVNSPYVKACGPFQVKVPTAPLPQLLVLTSPKDHPLSPMYAKWTAEWQVDHWQFEAAQENSIRVVLNAGKPRSEFTGPTMAKGSPEAEKVLGEVRDAINQTRKEIDAIRGRYAEQVVNGTKPGTVYTGKVSYGSNVAPCELKFLDPAPGADARFASFQITLSGQNPPCWYVYKARVTTELPIPVPGVQPTPTDPYAVGGFNDSNAVPTHNIFPNRVRSSNYKVNRETLADYLASNEHGGQALLLLDGHIEGTINDFGAFPGVQLSVQSKP